MLRGIARAAAGLALALAAGGAQAAVCQSRALLCVGCASQIRVVVTPAGHCRITFTPGGFAQSLRLEVVGASHRRLAEPRWRRPAVTRLAPGGRCFVAADRRYCE